MWPFKKCVDNFKLDLHRAVLIDNEIFVISRFGADGSMAKLRSLNVTFEPIEDFLNRNSVTAME